MSKPNANAFLKNLPPERQDQIAEWCAKPNDRDAAGKPIPQTGGLAFARAHLLADGESVSLTALSEFFQWWKLQQEFRAHDAEARQVEEMLRDKFPDATPEKIAACGQLVFTLRAKNSDDAATFIALEKLRLEKETATLRAELEKTKVALKSRGADQKDRQLQQAERALDQAERRVRLLEEREAKARETITNSSLSLEERQARIKEIFGVQ